jgi:hypothetical protein
MAKPKITIGKYMGDDQYSYAVFVNGRPVYTGCDRREAQWRRKDLIKSYSKK